MHHAELPADLQTFIEQRFGRPHRFNDLDPKRTALVVIDMQRIFCAPGALIEVPVAREIVPNINQMADALRSAGGTIAWVRSAFPPSDRDWTVMFDGVNPAAQGDRVRSGLQSGTEEWQLWDGLVPQPGDIEVEKDRYSAFLPGACALPQSLRAQGVDTVLIAGTLTNVCCDSSARDAMMDNFRVVFLSDANATRSDAEHMGTLVTIARSFGDVQTVEQAIGYLRDT